MTAVIGTDGRGRGRLRAVLWACVVLLVASVGPGRAEARQARAPVHLERVRSWCSGKYTRVVLDLDGQAEYKVGRLRGNPSAGRPARIYLDLLNTLRNPSLPVRAELKEGPVRCIRTARHDRTTTRLVLDLRRAEDYRVFRLEDPCRIVLDLWWTKRDRPAGGKKKGRGASGRSTPALPLIVVDPGHGGEDPGAVGKRGLKEKDVVLAIAKEVKVILERKKKARVLLTRQTDRYLSLDRRTWFANSKGADLFVSIHANAHPSSKVRGVETYYLDNTTDRASMRLAAIENATSHKKWDDLRRILLDLQFNANAWESYNLAHTMQKALVKGLKGKGYKDVRDLGAKGNLFYVLVGAHMPSILVEVAFITNPVEEKRLRSRSFRKVLAQGIARGILDYLAQGGAARLVARQEAW